MRIEYLAAIAIAAFCRRFSLQPEKQSTPVTAAIGEPIG